MFPENLSRLQTEHGETNYRLAKSLGIHQSTVASWKSGERRPHPKHLTALADHFAVTVDELLSDAKQDGA